MIQTTMKEALARKDEIKDHYLYLIRNENGYLYVGQSKHPFKRLRNHINAWESRIGAYIKRSKPDSLLWVIELFTIEECEPIIMEHRHLNYKSYWLCKSDPSRFKRALDIAEAALIHCYQPAHNSSLNGLGSGYALEERELVNLFARLNLDDNAVDFIHL